jgi:hypothetical protein
MSNKEIASFVQLFLAAANKEVKIAEIYEKFSHLCGYRDWNSAKALGVDFVAKIPPILKTKVENQIAEIPDSSWKKHMAIFLLDANEMSVKDLGASLSVLSMSTDEMAEASSIVANLNRRSVASHFIVSLFEHPSWATTFITDKKMYAHMLEEHEELTEIEEFCEPDSFSRSKRGNQKSAKKKGS